MSVERSELSVERSGAAGHAVFLSYASQDAEAARRICAALRSAGVEVWFDQSELRGGDSWDAKIRRQIKECALFIPIISATTQARPEGYFRLEWRLADQRTHLMGRNKAFLLPVCIDATPDANADVPDSFTTVQWTRLKEAEALPAFAARVGKLLSGDVTGVVDPAPTANYLWLVPAIAGAIAIAGIAAWMVLKPGATAKPQSLDSKPVAVSPGASELARVRAQLTPDRWQREDFAAMAPTLDRLIQANSELADAWAMRSIINSLQVLRNYDSSTKPLEVGKADADRAMRLAPGSPLADIATGMHLVAMTSRGGDARACRPYLDRGVAALPPDALTRYAQLASFWFAYDFDQVQRLGEAWRAEDPSASFPPWIFAQLNVVRRHPAEAEKWAEIAKADPNITGVRAHFTAFESKYYLRADLPAAWEVLQQVPAAGRSVHRVVHARWLVAMADHRWDEALQELAQVPETFLFDRAYHGPKALLAGLAHQRAGRPDAAAAQFREAERLLREHLAVDSDNEELHLVLAVALACAGRGGDARNELALVEPLVKGRAPSIYRGTAVLTIAQAYAVLGDTSRLAPWLRKLLAEPSQFPFTPASLRLDPRFTSTTAAPEIQALLQEFAGLDQPVVKTEDRSQKTEASAPIDQKSVAVLAFANLSDDKSNEYFSDGISEELLNVLAKIPGLKVSARTSAFYFKGKEVPVPEIARQLGVAYVVEGSVRKSGDKVRITAQLIKAEGGFHVWSETFTRDLKDIFAVQDEIAGLIAQNLQLKLAVGGERAAVNPDTYELLLQARSLAQRASTEGRKQAIALYRRILVTEPRLAVVWAEMAYAYMGLGRFGGLPIAEGMREARAAAQQALSLDPDQPVGLDTLAWVQRTADWDWRGARRSFERAMALAPGDPGIRVDAAVLYFNIGRVEEAIALARQAVERDPLNVAAQFYLGVILEINGRFEESLPPLAKAVELAPAADEFHTHVARALISLGRLAEAEQMVEQEPNEAYRLVGRAQLRHARGDQAGAGTARDELIAKYGAEIPGYVALTCALLGDPEQAFAWLDRALARRDAAVVWAKTNFYLRSLHGDPRWPAFLVRLGLADDQLK